MMRGFPVPGWILGLPLAVLLHAPAGAESPQCRMECDAAGAASNPAVVRLCLTRCEVRRSALGTRGPEGTTAMVNPRTAWTVGPAQAGRAPAPTATQAGPTQLAARATPGRTTGARGPAAPLPPTLSTAVAQARPQPPGQGFMASVMGAQAATLPPGVTPTRGSATPPGRRTN